MVFPIHEKIELQLRLSKRRKKDLASFLGIAPQTMTDICKGRSAVTLTHLKGLVRYFGLRSNYWLDDERRDPDPFDRLDLFGETDLRHLEALLLSERPSDFAARELSASLQRREENFANQRLTPTALRQFLLRIHVGDGATQHGTPQHSVPQQKAPRIGDGIGSATESGH
ncbi:MAG: hypothetical protein H6833_06710 [Planctomycetes bacterium]|nr:hypothetical protein [Planctomycetota bacterium]